MHLYMREGIVARIQVTVLCKLVAVVVVLVLRREMIREQVDETDGLGGCAMAKYCGSDGDRTR